jgi:hypothetical protein
LRCVSKLGNAGRATWVLLISSTDDLRLMVMRDIIATVSLRVEKTRCEAEFSSSDKEKTHSKYGAAAMF